MVKLLTPAEDTFLDLYLVEISNLQGGPCTRALRAWGLGPIQLPALLYAANESLRETGVDTLVWLERKPTETAIVPWKSRDELLAREQELKRIYKVSDLRTGKTSH